ncbi:MAG: cytochrome c oxidase assembly protein, partial [Anaerolineales bacterium]
MDETPGLWEVISSSSFDVIWTAVLLAWGAWYVLAVGRLSATKPRVNHPWWRTACFLAGLALIAVAVMSPIHEYGSKLLWVNFTGFLVLTMLAPPLLVLGRPLTLGFRTSGPAGRRRLRHFYRSPAVSAFTFPVAAWLLFAGVTYLWQFSDLTELAATDWMVRDIQEFTLLLVGISFWYVALAADPVRWRMAYTLRVFYVGVEMVHKG